MGYVYSVHRAAEKCLQNMSRKPEKIHYHLQKKNSAIGPYFETDKFIPRPPRYFVKMHFTIILPSTPTSCK